MITVVSSNSNGRNEEGHLIQTQRSYNHCEESMGDVYQKLLEPPTELKKVAEGKKIDIICG
jgi:hypothetical protein